MKHWINTHYKSLIIAAFLIPIITVAVVSISHVTKWYGISNPVSWAIYLSIGIEIAALSALAAISADMGKKVYFPFAIVTLVQFIGNIFFAYSYIDVTSKLFLDWVDLVSPLVSFMGVEPTDIVGHKRFLAFFAGGMLPIISLSFLHMLVKFTEEDRKNEEKILQDEQKHVIDDKLIQEAIEKYKKESEEKVDKVESTDLVSEISRIRLSEDDLKKLEEVLLNPPQPNNALESAKIYYEQKVRETNEQKLKKSEQEKIERPIINDTPISREQTTLEFKSREEILSEMMQKDQELGLYDEDLIGDDEIISTIEPSIEEEEVNFSTIEPITENIFQEEDYKGQFNDWEIETVPEPFATEEEDINEVLNEIQSETLPEVDSTTPDEDVEKKNN